MAYLVRSSPLITDIKALLAELATIVSDITSTKKAFSPPSGATIKGALLLSIGGIKKASVTRSLLSKENKYGLELGYIYHIVLRFGHNPT